MDKWGCWWCDDHVCVNLSLFHRDHLNFIKFKQKEKKEKNPLWHLPKTWPKKSGQHLNQNRKHKNYLHISTPTNKGQPWKNNYPLPPQFPSGLVSRPKPNSLSRSHMTEGSWGEWNPGLGIALRTAAGSSGVGGARGWTDEFTQTQKELKSQQPGRVEQENPSKNPKARILNSHGGQLTPVGTQASTDILWLQLGHWPRDTSPRKALSLGAFELTGKKIRII